MKIGLSYSKCLADIAKGEVDVDDVLIIVSSTNFDPLNNNQWADIWAGYHQGGWYSAAWSSFDRTDEELLRDLTIRIHNAGKLFQPRKEALRLIRPSLTYHWLDAILISKDLENIPAAKAAWDQFQMIAGLSDIKITT